MDSNTILSTNNPVFMVYVTWTGFLIIKMLLMSLLTGAQRFRTKAYANHEDQVLRPGGEIRVDENVERVRRAHLNDMENILPYLMAAFLYVLTEPDFYVASILFRVATIARILHTVVYAIYPVRQPARALMFFIHYLIMLYMIVASIVHFFKF